MRTARLGELKRLVGAIDHDDLRRTKCCKNLNPDMPESAGADHRNVFVRQQVARRLLGRAIRRQTRVGVWSDILWCQRLGQLDERAKTCEQVLRVTAVGVDSGKGTIKRVHVVAAPASQAMTVFRTKFSTFVDEGRRKERQRLEDEVGSQFVSTIENTRQFPMIQGVSRPRLPLPKEVAPQFVSADPTIAGVVRRVESAAARKMPILIRGETGTGKEQLARHAHAASGRAGAFVPVNCAALPDSLIEAELFGYADGAFTGAQKGGAAGLFKEAGGGTLFLEEIGDMPVTLQAVLLRFLDDWTVRPVGGTKRQIDVLLVSATNVNLDELIAKGRFRSDLLFRLNTLEVTLPPLRERSDFAEIVRHLIEKIDPSADLTESAIDRLAELNWDGNIRELRNVLSRLSLAERGNLIDETAVESVVGHSSSELLPGRASGDSGLKQDLHEIQRAHVLTAYAETGNNISKTARRLGVSRNTIYRALRDKQADAIAKDDEGFGESSATCHSRKALHTRNLIHYHVQLEGAVFEPENSLEALMQAAGKDPGVVPAFYRALLETEIYVLTHEAPMNDSISSRHSNRQRNLSKLRQ